MWLEIDFLVKGHANGKVVDEICFFPWKFMWKKIGFILFDWKVFFIDRKVFSVDQLSGRQTNTKKFGKWFSRK